MLERAKFLGEALDGLGRWYVAVPPILMASILISLFFVTGAGQARLQLASGQLQTAAARVLAVDDLEDAVLRAQGDLRSYLLTDDARYLGAYRTASTDIEPRLAALRHAYVGAPPVLAVVHRLDEAVGKRLGELGVALGLHDSADPGRAVTYIKSKVGMQTSRDIAAAIDELRREASRERVEAATHWESSLRWSRWITTAGTIVNLLLVGVTSRLVYRDMRRRALLTAELRDQNLQLEREVEARTRELVELSTHLQSVAEREKASLARELHDELGGLLVGARMDISWAERQLAPGEEDLRQRLARIQQTLAAGVDLKRRIVEELRPTLLDNVGLFAALRWQLEETCGRAGIRCSEYYPDQEPPLTSQATIALFRIAQESFLNIVKHSGADAVEVALDVDEDMVVLRITDNGGGIPAERFNAIGSHGLASMRHRVRALGGRFEVGGAPAGGTVVVARIPVSNALQPAAVRSGTN